MHFSRYRVVVVVLLETRTRASHVGAIPSRSCRLFANSVQETAVANSSTNTTTTTVIMVHEATWHPFLTTKRGSGTFSIICIRSLDSTSHDTHRNVVRLGFSRRACFHDFSLSSPTSLS